MSTFNFNDIPEFERRKLFEMAKANRVTPEEMAAHIIRLWFVLQDCANGKPTLEVILPVSKKTHTIQMYPEPSPEPDPRVHDALWSLDLR